MLRIQRISYKTIVYLAVSIIVITDVLQSSLLRYSDPNIIRALSWTCILMRILIFVVSLYIFSKHRHKLKYFYFAAFIIMISACACQRNFVFFDLFFLPLFIGDELEYDQVARCFFLSIIVGSILVVALYMIGHFPDFRIIRSDTLRVRQSFGFAHPNTTGGIVFYLCLLYIIIKNNKLRVVDLFVLLFVSVWLYVYPNSITSAILVFALFCVELTIIIYGFFLRKDLISSRWIKCFSMTLIPAIISFLFYTLIKGFGRNVINDIGTTIAGRYVLAKSGISRYGIHLFNIKKILFTGTADKYFGSLSEYFVVDNLYIYVLLVFGIVPSLFFFYFYYSCIKRSLRSRNTALWIVLMLLLFYSLTESYLATDRSAFVFMLAYANYFKEPFTKELLA